MKLKPGVGVFTSSGQEHSTAPRTHTSAIMQVLQLLK